MGHIETVPSASWYLSLSAESIRIQLEAENIRISSIGESGF